jgi:hypothetical protein
MVLLLSLFLLFYQASDLPAAKLSAVDFSAIKQGKVEHDQGCFDFYAGQITFRVKNRSDKTVYIRGLQSDSGRYPFGYLIRFDSEKNQWLNTEGDTLHRSFKEFMSPPVQIDYESEVYVLPPGKSMKFDELAKKSLLGSRLKRGIFISFDQNEEPLMVTSEEFILR